MAGIHPSTEPGGRPTSDHWVTVFSACSVLCTVAALVCLGLLVFTGDDRRPGSAKATNNTVGNEHGGSVSSVTTEASSSGTATAKSRKVRNRNCPATTRTS